MFNKKSSIGKKGGLLQISAFSLVFSFISIIYIFISVFGWAASNDYLFYNLQNVTETLEEGGIIKNGTSTMTQEWGDDFRTFNFHLDDLWFISYLVFVISSFIVAYKTDRQNYFSFLGLLFYGLMAMLFMLTIFSTLTEWFKDQILVNIVPSASILVPKFYYYLDNIGVFSALHLALCLLINMLDFDFAKIYQKKKQEELTIGDDEVI